VQRGGERGYKGKKTARSKRDFEGDAIRKKKKSERREGVICREKNQAAQRANEGARSEKLKAFSEETLPNRRKVREQTKTPQRRPPDFPLKEDHGV